MSKEKDDRIWEAVQAITKSKDQSLLEDPDFESFYTPFVVNRVLGHHEDTVLAANLMNERHWIDPRLQFLFLTHTIRPRYRRSEWLKPTYSEDLWIVAEYYGCSLRKAGQLLPLHTPQQCEIMRARIDKGGPSKPRT